MIIDNNSILMKEIKEKQKSRANINDLVCMLKYRQITFLNNLLKEEQ